MRRVATLQLMMTSRIDERRMHMRTFNINVTMPNGVIKSETAYTKDYALNKAKFLAKQGKEVEVRDDKYGLLYFS